MGEFGQGKGDGHRYVHGVPDQPDDKFWNWVEEAQKKLPPKEKAIFKQELEEELLKGIQKDADATAARSMDPAQSPHKIPVNEMQRQMDEMAKLQTKAFQEKKEQIIKDLLKTGAIQSRAEIEDYRHPRFKDTQHYLNPAYQEMMKIQQKMLPPNQHK